MLPHRLVAYLFSDRLQKPLPNGLAGLGSEIPEMRSYDSMDSPQSAYRYALRIKGIYRNGEKLIKTSPCYAFAYARDVIKGPWPEAEDVILTDGYYAAHYAMYILGKRWPEAEEIIKTGVASADYARKFLNGSWDNVISKEEQEALTSGGRAYAYAVKLNKRFLKGEIIIKTSPMWAFYYARDVIKGRWLEAEDVIKTDGYIAAHYAISVLNSRWLQAEEIIYKSWDSNLYAQKFLGGSWGNLYSTQEEIALQKPANTIATTKAEQEAFRSAESAFHYARYFIHGRWEKGEAIIKTSPQFAYLYAASCLKGRWEEGEAVIYTSDYYKNLYEYYVLQTPGVQLLA